ncbi:MAG: hypothetical protein M3040_10000 [Bacteroidota bacterium]|nr:hypothetical protein [Bacteroidota bacterium]
MQKNVHVREQMFNIISKWQGSGLSQKAYCEQHNIHYHVFHYWYKCFRDLQSAAKGWSIEKISILSSKR